MENILQIQFEMMYNNAQFNSDELTVFEFRELMNKLVTRKKEEKAEIDKIKTTNPKK